MNALSNNALKRRLRSLVAKNRAAVGLPIAERLVDEMLDRGMYATLATILGGNVNG